MTAANDTYALLGAFVDELARCGMTHATTSPGSRCAPLVLTLTADSRIECSSHIDERCSGFHALGVARASGRPVAITCTSGTAAANLLPAVVEAHEAGVPLIVLTADRPPELRDVGAGQAIDQLKLYGSAVKWFVEVGNHDATPQRVAWMRSLACRAFGLAAERRPGPVHLNFPLREPLVADRPVEIPGGRRAGRPWVAFSESPAKPSAWPSGYVRPVIVAGRGCGEVSELRRVAAARRIPLLADPLSGARGGDAAIANYDLLLREPRFEADCVVRLGDLPTSKPLRRWLAGLTDAHQVAAGSRHDPDAVVAEFTDALALGNAEPAEPGWLEHWQAADRAAAALLDAQLADGLSEPAIARLLGTRLDAASTLVVGASMPIRDVETFWPARDAPPRVIANRGANGIDGTLATAFGVASVAGPTVALVGDVTFAHDIGALAAARRLAVSLTIVVINNGGGAIFDFLPVARSGASYERYIATPPDLEPAAAAELFGLSFTHATSQDELWSAIESADGPAIVEVRTDRAENLRLHRELAAAAISAAYAPASTGSSAASLTSVSASSSSGSEPPTTPTPA